MSAFCVLSEIRNYRKYEFLSRKLDVNGLSSRICYRKSEICPSLRIVCVINFKHRGGTTIAAVNAVLNNYIPLSFC